MSLEYYEKKEKFKSGPLHKNSKLLITGLDYDLLNSYYVLSNGNKINQNSLNNIREVAKILGNKANLSSFLTKFKINKDEFEGNYFIPQM